MPEHHGVVWLEPIQNPKIRGPACPTPFDIRVLGRGKLVWYSPSVEALNRLGVGLAPYGLSRTFSAKLVTPCGSLTMLSYRRGLLDRDWQRRSLFKGWTRTRGRDRPRRAIRYLSLMASIVLGRIRTGVFPVARSTIPPLSACQFILVYLIDHTLIISHYGSQQLGEEVQR